MSNYITIGMDLGNRKHTVCALDQTGNVLWRKDVANTPEALKPFFEENAGATVAMETGLCCRWVSALAKSCGCDALVGNARKLAAIWQSKQKNDENDALLIAELARASRRLFHPVELRDDERHEMVQLIELREVAVSQRTQAVNSVRGLCKAHGVFIPKCDASCFHKVAAGAYFGLTPGQDKSGDKDAPKHITKTGSALMRHLLVTAANHILRASSPDTALKRHGERICARGGKVARRKAKTAVARKLAVVMLAMLKSGKAYDDGIAAVKAGAGESTVAA